MRFQDTDILVSAESGSLLLDILRAIGIGNVRRAKDGAEALALVQLKRPDCLILDMDTLRDNLNAVHHIRRAETAALRRTPVIVVATSATRHHASIIRDAGADALLLRPLSISKVQGRIQTLFLFPRPFIENETYCGPDRRQSELQFYRGPFRRSTDRAEDEQAEVLDIA